jgi:hypothetical protein
MDGSAELLEKREHLKREMTASVGKTLPALAFDAVGRSVRVLTRSRRPVSWYYSVVVLTLIILLPGLLIAALLREVDQVKALGWVWVVAQELVLLATAMALILIRHFLAVMRDHLVDAIESTGDLADLQRWVADGRCIRKSLAITIPFGVSWCVVATLLFSLYWGSFIGFNLALGTLVFGMILGMDLYYMLWALHLPFRLSRYHYRLYEVDPINSEVVDYLARMLNRYVYVVAIFFALCTFMATYISVAAWSAVVLIPIVWIPLILQFISNQTALNQIVSTAKWKTLNELQTKIRKLRTEANLADKETVEAINRLMDLHDRIKTTRNSTLDVRTGLSFLNQLMLPLMAFLLANVERLGNLIR